MRGENGGNMKNLEVNVNDLPESLRKQILAVARKRALTAEQRRVARAIDALRKAGVDVQAPEFPLPESVTIKLR
jgi:hypothetical protein